MSNSETLRLARNSNIDALLKTICRTEPNWNKAITRLRQLPVIADREKSGRLAKLAVQEIVDRLAKGDPTINPRPLRVGTISEGYEVGTNLQQQLTILDPKNHARTQTECDIVIVEKETNTPLMIEVKTCGRKYIDQSLASATSLERIRRRVQPICEILHVKQCAYAVMVFPQYLNRIDLTFIQSGGYALPFWLSPQQYSEIVSSILN